MRVERLSIAFGKGVQAVSSLLCDDSRLAAAHDESIVDEDKLETLFAQVYEANGQNGAVQNRINVAVAPE